MGPLIRVPHLANPGLHAETRMMESLLFTYMIMSTITLYFVSRMPHTTFRFENTRWEVAYPSPQARGPQFRKAGIRSNPSACHQVCLPTLDTTYQTMSRFYHCELSHSQTQHWSPSHFPTH